MTRDEIMQLDGTKFDKAVAEAMGILHPRWGELHDLMQEYSSGRQQSHEELAKRIRRLYDEDVQLPLPFHRNANADYRVLEWVRGQVGETLKEFSSRLTLIWWERLSEQFAPDDRNDYMNCMYQPGDYGRALLLAKAEVAK